MNDLLNALQMLQLPFALLPILTFTSSKFIMRDFRISLFSRILLGSVACLLILINLYFIFDFIYSNTPHSAGPYIGIAVLMIVYLILMIYFVIYCLISMGMTGLGERLSFTRLFPAPIETSIDAPWLANETVNASVGTEEENSDQNTSKGVWCDYCWGRMSNTRDFLESKISLYKKWCASQSAMLLYNCLLSLVFYCVSLTVVPLFECFSSAIADDGTLCAIWSLSTVSFELSILRFVL